MDPSIEYIRNTLAFVTDVYMFYGTKVEKLVKTTFTENLMKVLKKHMHESESNKDILDYALNVKFFCFLYNIIRQWV